MVLIDAHGMINLRGSGGIYYTPFIRINRISLWILNLIFDIYCLDIYKCIKTVLGYLCETDDEKKRTNQLVHPLHWYENGRFVALFSDIKCFCRASPVTDGSGVQNSNQFCLIFLSRVTIYQIVNQNRWS